MQVQPMKSKSKAPGTKLFKLEYDNLLSIFAFNFNLRRFNKAVQAVMKLPATLVGRCRLTLSNPR